MNCVDVAKDRGNDALKGFAFRFQQLREIGIRRSNVRHSLSITLFESPLPYPRSIDSSTARARPMATGSAASTSGDRPIPYASPQTGRPIPSRSLLNPILAVHPAPSTTAPEAATIESRTSNTSVRSGLR